MQICAVLYPGDGTEAGKLLRLKQQYMLCSASVQVRKTVSPSRSSSFRLLLVGTALQIVVFADSRVCCLSSSSDCVSARFHNKLFFLFLFFFLCQDTLRKAA
jgi:hypothetical protein